MALDGLLPTLPFAGHKALFSAGGNCAGLHWLEPAQSLFSNNRGSFANARATRYFELAGAARPSSGVLLLCKDRRDLRTFGELGVFLFSFGS